MNPQFEEILKKGEHYYPAQKHYLESNGVRCDRCGKSPLLGAIGYKEFDLCYLCADTVSKFTTHTLDPLENTTKYLDLTLMMQNQFNTSNYS